MDLTLRQMIVLVAERYVANASRAKATISTKVFGNGIILDRLAMGECDITTGTFERAMQWFSDNWPEGAVWPADVPRPAAKGEAA